MRGIEYLSQQLFFYKRVRDFFDEIFNQSVAKVKNLTKKVEKLREKEMFFGENTERAPFNQ